MDNAVKELNNIVNPGQDGTIELDGLNRGGQIENILNPGGTGGGSPGTSLSNLTGTSTTFNELGSRKDPEFYKLWKYFQRAA